MMMTTIHIGLNRYKILRYRIHIGLRIKWPWMNCLMRYGIGQVVMYHYHHLCKNNNTILRHLSYHLEDPPPEQPPQLHMVHHYYRLGPIPVDHSDYRRHGHLLWGLNRHMDQFHDMVL